VKRVAILGSTGSIGRNALRVLDELRDEYQVVALAARQNADLLASQCRETRPERAALCDEAATQRLRASMPDLPVYAGIEGLLRLLRESQPDVVVSAIAGAAGLLPTFEAVRIAKRVAVANKEPLVMAGHLLMALARDHGTEILPVDSEHSALFQCLEGRQEGEIRRLVITGSGGPFRTWDSARLAEVTPDQALAHPTWSMGSKISVDSATLMNKGLEVLEASRLFGLSGERIQVVIHPESKIHGLVEFSDGSWICHMGPTDMRIPIQYALTYPQRGTCPVEPLDLSSLGVLRLEEPRMEDFPCLAHAYEALKLGGTCPTALNAANEEAVWAFLEGRISFLDISTTVREVMDGWTWEPEDDLERILEADREARRRATRSWIHCHGYTCVSKRKDLD